MRNWYDVNDVFPALPGSQAAPQYHQCRLYDNFLRTFEGCEGEDWIGDEKPYASQQKSFPEQRTRQGSHS